MLRVGPLLPKTMRKNLSLGLVLTGLIVVFLTLALRSRPYEEPFKFKVSRYTSSPTGMYALVECTNRTRTYFNAVIETQTPTDAGWQPSSLQPEIQVSHPLGIYGRWTHRWLIPVPMESSTWRLQIQLSQAMNKQERNLDSYLNRVHLHWPFHRTWNPSKPERVITSPVFNRPSVSNQRIEPVTGSAATLIPISGAVDALLVMAHPHRSAAVPHRTRIVKKS